MNINEVFSGKWHYCAGGSAPDSRKFCFEKLETGSFNFNFVYKFDIDEIISMHFTFTEKEIEMMKEQLGSKGTARIEGLKNQQPFLLEFRIIAEQLEMRFEGFDMVWPGHHQHFSTPDYQAIMFGDNS